MIPANFLRPRVWEEDFPRNLISPISENSDWTDSNPALTEGSTRVLNLTNEESEFSRDFSGSSLDVIRLIDPENQNHTGGRTGSDGRRLRLNRTYSQYIDSDQDIASSLLTCCQVEMGAVFFTSFVHRSWTTHFVLFLIVKKKYFVCSQSYRPFRTFSHWTIVQWKRSLSKIVRLVKSFVQLKKQ